MSGRRVFLYVQHLLGVGHLKRSATLGRALAEAGLEVTLASGGAPVPGAPPPGVRFVQLPPVRALDANFKALVDEAGEPIGERWKARRREALIEAYLAARPHALLIELFPFGRRQMRFELEPLLERACGSPRRPLIVSSVRDLLGGRRDRSREDEMLELFERWFDRLLVHGDPAFLPFERTFRHAARLGARLHYTGYLVDRASATDGETGRGEILVSAGGGAVGERLLETAIGCRLLGTAANRTWRVLAGVNAADSRLEHLARLAAGAQGEGRVLIERARSDFPVLLGNCALSISQAGYNTLLEILQARARAVVVPFAGGAETEQTLRARRLAEQGRVELLEEAALSPQALAAAVDRALAASPPGAASVDLQGARRSAELLLAWLRELPW